MRSRLSNDGTGRLVLCAVWFWIFAQAESQPARAQTCITVRVMASNLTSGNNQRYETPGLNILKGLKPDVVAMQEFNYSSASQGLNTPAAFREMVDTTFGTNFVYYRESGYSIPNGIISRYPVLASGSWTDSDTGVNDRGFAWARIDAPGTNDLYVVSVHLKASSGSASRRAAQVTEIRSLIAAAFPTNAWVIVAGDMNIYDEGESAVAVFATFLSDVPVPTDQNGDPDTNAGRAERYDRVLFSPAMAGIHVPVVMPSRTYTNGLVFDSRLYTDLADVPPVAVGDSGASQMQHMAVVRDFAFPVAAANSPALPPELRDVLWAEGRFRFLVTGSTGVLYVIEATSNMCSAAWTPLYTNAAPYTFSDPAADSVPQRFYRGRVAPQGDAVAR